MEKRLVEGKPSDSLKLTDAEREYMNNEVKTVKMHAAMNYAILSEYTKLAEQADKQLKKVRKKDKKLLFKYIYLASIANMVKYNSELSALQNLLGYDSNEVFMKESIELLEKEVGNIWEHIFRKEKK